MSGTAIPGPCANVRLTPIQRRILDVLIGLEGGERITVCKLAEMVYPPNRRPADPQHSIGSHIYFLRRRLAVSCSPYSIEYAPQGYRLDV